VDFRGITQKIVAAWIRSQEPMDCSGGHSHLDTIMAGPRTSHDNVVTLPHILLNRLKMDGYLWNNYRFHSPCFGTNIPPENTTWRGGGGQFGDVSQIARGPKETVNFKVARWGRTFYDLRHAVPHQECDIDRSREKHKRRMRLPPSRTQQGANAGTPPGYPNFNNRQRIRSSMERN